MEEDSLYILIVDILNDYWINFQHIMSYKEKFMDFGGKLEYFVGVN